MPNNFFNNILMPTLATLAFLLVGWQWGLKCHALISLGTKSGKNKM